MLVEALEVVARLLSVLDAAEAAEFLHAATVIRAEIRQPMPPTDAAELEATRRRIDALGLPAPTTSVSAAEVHAASDRGLHEGRTAAPSDNGSRSRCDRVAIGPPHARLTAISHAT